MILALAGRRLDAVDAKQQRFPAENVDMVRERIRSLLQMQSAVALVGSAACGTDLLALSKASKLGLRSRVVLPCGREKFRTTSVTDQQGDWGPLYDKLLNEVEKSGDLIVIHANPEDTAYGETNQSILDEALLLGRQLTDRVTAVLVWDGKSRGQRDVTEKFGIYARNKSGADRATDGRKVAMKVQVRSATLTLTLGEKLKRNPTWQCLELA
jgi:hypothetical protein